MFCPELNIVFALLKSSTLTVRLSESSCSGIIKTVYNTFTDKCEQDTSPNLHPF